MGKEMVKAILLDIVVKTGSSKEGRLSSNCKAGAELATFSGAKALWAGGRASVGLGFVSVNITWASVAGTK